MDMAAVRAAKKELRKALKQTIASVDKESVAAQSTIITSSLFALKEYQHAKRISVYLSMPAGEVQTPAIVRDALKSGKRVFVPYFYSVPVQNQAKRTLVMDMLELTSIRDYERLEPDSWGIPTLSEDSIKHRVNCFGGTGRSTDSNGAQGGMGLDLIVTPGLAFDRNIGRLGRGKGFYDRFFKRCQQERVRGAKAPWRVGLAMNEQVVPEIPMDDTDVRLDALILGDGTVVGTSG